MADPDRDQRLERLMDKFATGDRVTFEPLKLAADIRSLLSEARGLRAELQDWRNGRQLGSFQEDLNAERGRRLDAEAQAARLREAATALVSYADDLCDAWEAYRQLQSGFGGMGVNILQESAGRLHSLTCWVRLQRAVEAARQALAAGEAANPADDPAADLGRMR